MTTTTEKRKQRTITLTDRQPVKIWVDEWPQIASAVYEDYDNQYRFQATRITDISIRVRQHDDGRTIVYTVYDYDTHWQHEDGRVLKFGRLLDAGDDVPSAIRDVGSLLVSRLDEDDAQHAQDLIDQCIADLPATEL